MLQIKIAFIWIAKLPKCTSNTKQFYTHAPRYRPQYRLQSCFIETIRNYRLQWEIDESSYYVRLMMTTWWLKHRRFRTVISSLVLLKVIFFLLGVGGHITYSLSIACTSCSSIKDLWRIFPDLLFRQFFPILSSRSSSLKNISKTTFSQLHGV